MRLKRHVSKRDVLSVERVPASHHQSPLHVGKRAPDTRLACSLAQSARQLEVQILLLLTQGMT